MTKVTVEYLQANGRYRRGKAHTETQWPNFLVNHDDKQAHSLVDSPVFTLERAPVRFTDWESFIKAKPPETQHYSDRLLAVCEDQNIWPICDDIAPDIQDRQMQFKEFAEDAEQNAVASATRIAEGSALMSAWSVASLMIFCLVSAVILLIVLQSNLAQGLIPGAGAIGTSLIPQAASIGGSIVFILPLLGAIAISAPLPHAGFWVRRRAKAGERRFKHWETVRIWDETTNSRWSASLPLEILVQHIAQDCRYTQELTMSRLIAMGFFAAGIFLPGFLITTVLSWPIIWAILAPLVASTIGLGYGYIKGFQMFMLPPIWTVRRMYARPLVDEEDPDQGYQINFDLDPEILPEVHTKLTGMTVEMAVAERRSSAEEVIKAANEARSQTAGRGVTTAALSSQNLAVAYSPRIWRASMLYEMLKGRDVKARMKGPNNKQDRIQKISMAGMALGSVGLLIAVVVFVQ